MKSVHIKIVLLCAENLKIKNMIGLLKKLGLLSFTLLMLLVSGGFSVYNHYCSCADLTKASFFIESQDCSQHENEQSDVCCETVTAQSCCEPEPDHSSNSCTNDGCCRSASQFVKLNELFNVSVGKITLEFAVAFVQILETENITSDVASNHILTIEQYCNPPPDYGRKLILSLHQLQFSPEHA